MTSSATAPTLRSVAVPTEHGGWSLTLEPALLGLIVAPSIAGGALAAAALIGFVMRSPLRVVMVDRFRGRSLPRTALATRVVVIEATVLLAVTGVAALTADAAWWPPLVPAAALIAVGLGYDVRSRSRHLIPELAGTAGVAAVATMIALAGGTATPVAYGLWLVMAARAVAAVIFVRLQLRRAKSQPYRAWVSDATQASAAVLVLIGVAVDAVPVVGAAAVITLGSIHVILSRRPPPKTAMLGAQQVVLGLALVVATALGVLAP